MLVSPAQAGHGVVDTGSSGGATALTIILAVGISFLIFYLARQKWRRRRLARDDEVDPLDQ
jgi:hypothetical protein